MGWHPGAPISCCLNERKRQNYTKEPNRCPLCVRNGGTANTSDPKSPVTVPHQKKNHREAPSRLDQLCCAFQVCSWTKHSGHPSARIIQPWRTVQERSEQTLEEKKDTVLIQKNFIDGVLGKQKIRPKSHVLLEAYIPIETKKQE